MLRQSDHSLAMDQIKAREIPTLLEAGFALLDAGLAFADAVLAVVDLDFALVAAAFAATCIGR
jgi:hypothetical protein